MIVWLHFSEVYDLANKGAWAWLSKVGRWFYVLPRAECIHAEQRLQRRLLLSAQPLLLDPFPSAINFWDATALGCPPGGRGNTPWHVMGSVSPASQDQPDCAEDGSVRYGRFSGIRYVPCLWTKTQVSVPFLEFCIFACVAGEWGCAGFENSLGAASRAFARRRNQSNFGVPTFQVSLIREQTR